MSPLIVLLFLGLVSALYATAGQAGGSGFVAVMTFADFPSSQIRTTSFALNIVAAVYSVWHVHRAGLMDWNLLRRVLATSLPAAFLGGTISLGGKSYFLLTAALLVSASILMLIKADAQENAKVEPKTAWLAGGITGLVSGLSGVGGGVFLSALLILFAKVSPKKMAALSPPFILVNSALSLAGALITGARVPIAVVWFAFAALVGSAVGTAVGLRWMSANAIRRVLAAILVVGAAQMVLRALG
ncbi:MAG: sulfite exporter TauE/SafE family protein [Rhizomicrobium sp.]